MRLGCVEERVRKSVRVGIGEESVKRGESRRW